MGFGEQERSTKPPSTRDILHKYAHFFLVCSVFMVRSIWRLRSAFEPEISVPPNKTPWAPFSIQMRIAKEGLFTRQLFFFRSYNSRVYSVWRRQSVTIYVVSRTGRTGRTLLVCLETTDAALTPPPHSKMKPSNKQTKVHSFVSRTEARV